jgi:hypothetical protein
MVFIHEIDPMMEMQRAQEELISSPPEYSKETKSGDTLDWMSVSADEIQGPDFFSNNPILSYFIKLR